MGRLKLEGEGAETAGDAPSPIRRKDCPNRDTMNPSPAPMSRFELRQVLEIQRLPCSNGTSSLSKSLTQK